MEDANSVLDGLTITNGYADNYGGAIYCRYSSPTISNCIITNNSTEDSGGGIYCDRSDSIIRNCTITGNSVKYGENGSGICCFDSNSTILNCLISSNATTHFGSNAIYISGSVKIKGNTVSYNSLEAIFGDAIEIWGGYSDVVEISDNTFIDDGIRFGGYLQNAIISNNIFKDFMTGFDKYAIGLSGTGNANNTIIVKNNIFSNFANEGGHVYAITISGTGNAVNHGIIENNTFENIQGGAIDLGGTGGATIHGNIQNNMFRNCGWGEDGLFFEIIDIGGTGSVAIYASVTGNLIHNSYQGIRIGGISSSKQYGIFKNNTIVNNTVGIAKLSRVNSLEIVNCILWNNTDDLVNVSDLEITYSDISDGDYNGTNGNISLDPLFVNPGYNDYHLLEGSPCIDTGDPNYIPEPGETDIDGNPRIIGGQIDMGAYEAQLDDPIELLDILAQDVIDLELQHGIENGLLAKLDTAIEKLEDENKNNDVVAVNSLQAFINAVQAQRCKKIPEDADKLIAAAQEIINLLSKE
jgi:predicted outer membrane repeat protein